MKMENLLLSKPREMDKFLFFSILEKYIPTVDFDEMVGLSSEMIAELCDYIKLNNQKAMFYDDIERITCEKILISDSFPEEDLDIIFENVLVKYLGHNPSLTRSIFTFTIDEDLQGTWSHKK
jgi:hypothetical protein